MEQEAIINNVLQDCAQEIESFDAQIESEISQTLEVQLSHSNFNAYGQLVNSLRAVPQIESRSALEADLKDFTERACAGESFDRTTWIDQECHFQAYKQELEAFLAELRPPGSSGLFDGPGSTISYRGQPSNISGSIIQSSGGGGHWNNGGGNNDGSNWHGDDFNGGDPR